MKKVFSFLSLLFIIIFGYGLYIFVKPEVNVPNFLIQRSVNKKFPMEKGYVVGKLKLTNPKVSLSGDKLIIKVHYANDAVGDTIKGTMKFETKVRYDYDNSELYLDSFKLMEVTNDGNDVNMQKHPIIRTALNSAFKTLEKDPVLDLKKYSFVEDIQIIDGKFILYK